MERKGRKREREMGEGEAGEVTQPLRALAALAKDPHLHGGSLKEGIGYPGTRVTDGTMWVWN